MLTNDAYIHAYTHRQFYKNSLKMYRFQICTFVNGNYTWKYIQRWNLFLIKCKNISWFPNQMQSVDKNNNQKNGKNNWKHVNRKRTKTKTTTRRRLAVTSNIRNGKTLFLQIFFLLCIFYLCTHFFCLFKFNFLTVPYFYYAILFLKLTREYWKKTLENPWKLSILPSTMFISRFHFSPLKMQLIWK